MTREQQYKSQMQALGIYDPAFDPAIKTLGMMERELQRTIRAWKESAPEDAKTASVEHKLYGIIQQQRKDILAVRESLGLTPKSLRRIRGVAEAASDSGNGDISDKLDVIARQCGL